MVDPSGFCQPGTRDVDTNEDQQRESPASAERERSTPQYPESQELSARKNPGKEDARTTDRARPQVYHRRSVGVGVGW
jgi:hypothetical protein